jgi:hypothetical protein
MEETMRQAALLFGVVSAGVATAVRAEVKVEGTVTDLHVTTGKDTISQVLSALAVSFNLRYRSSVGLDAVAGATYSGSLGEVIGRLLDGYSYVIKKDHDIVEVVVVGSNGGRPIPVQAPPPKKDIRSQWR